MTLCKKVVKKCQHMDGLHLVQHLMLLLHHHLTAITHVCRSKRLTYSENGITNGLEVYEARSGASHVMTSNNDAAVRVLDTSSLQCIG